MGPRHARRRAAGGGGGGAGPRGGGGGARLAIEELHWVEGCAEVHLPRRARQRGLRGSPARQVLIIGASIGLPGVVRAIAAAGCNLNRVPLPY